jgi:hypothetical protein
MQGDLPMKNYELWDWPKKWVLMKDHPPTDINPEKPVMANITCRFCGKVFVSQGRRSTHEEASRHFKRLIPGSLVEGDWRGCPTTPWNAKRSRLIKFVPPHDEASAKAIARWHFDPRGTAPKVAENRYKDTLTSNVVFTADQKVGAKGAEGAEDAEDAEDWSKLPGATLRGLLNPNIFDEAAASSQAVLDDDFPMDDFPMDDFPMDDFPMGEDPLVDFQMDDFPMGERSSFEESMGGRRKTRKKRRTKKKKRKTRKKKRKTRKKKRKKRRKTRKKKRR